ncbi:hypothetical protein [Pediococcus acidilactici]|uniref:hypothetical protein n=1 Tax=Pediococcus acidilactici TaxID=1254 RepID=UPI00137B9B4A|nr:hypothetical protein [Pediococcus acidilactici]QHS02486.1 hypothetical protein GWA24_01460 [Pediococcus acidilactici]
MKKINVNNDYSDEERATAADCWMISINAQKLYMMRDSLEKIKYDWIGRRLGLNNSSKKIDEIIESLERQANELMLLSDMANQALFKEALRGKN